MRSPSQALLLAVLMMSLILPPALPAATKAPFAPVQKTHGHERLRRILLVGDSLSIGLGQQLEAVLADQPGVRFGYLGKVSSGLANPAFFDWDAQLADLVADQHPDMVLVMVGANDDKPLPGPDGKQLPFGARRWDAAYAARLSRLHAIVKADNPEATVWFIGVPVMADAAFDREMLHINALIADTARKLPDANYIDVRDVLADASGSYAAVARTPDGGVTKLRAADGVHISGAGSRLLAARCLEAVSDAAGLPKSQVLASIEDRDARPVSLPVPQATATTVQAAVAAKPLPTAAAPSRPAATLVPAAAPTAGYTVADGDTLWSVAKRLGVSPEALARANPGVDPRRMSIGQSLAVPADARPAAVAQAAAPAAATGHGHVVADGDNYWSVARRYDVSVAALTAANPGVDPTRLRIGQELAIPAGSGQAASAQASIEGRYVVADGDNLWSIAHRLGIDVAELTRANAAVDPHKLRPGQVLSLPGVTRAEDGDRAPARETPTVSDAALYPVAKGDTLWALARRFGVDLDMLLTANGEIDPSRLQVGQLVTIPAGRMAAADVLAFPVAEGDSLAGIARRFGISVAALAAANPDVDPLHLRKGQVLHVPTSLAAVAASGATGKAEQSSPAKAPAQTADPAEAAPVRSLREHTVSLGDTIWELGRRYGISVERILSENGGIDPSRLQVGQTVRLPDNAVAMAAVR